MERNLEALGFTVKTNGMVDFNKPPTGKIFVPVITNEEDVSLRGIDRRFFTMHKFSLTWELVVMEVVDEKFANVVKDYIEGIKTDYKRQERLGRCRIRSPKTGRTIFCTTENSCSTCPLREEDKMKLEMVELDTAKDISSCVWSDKPTEDLAVEQVTWTSFKNRLPENLQKFLKMLESGESKEEILRRFGKRANQDSWYYFQINKIKSLWEERR